MSSAAVVLLSLAAATASPAAPSSPQSATVIGPQNGLLADGAAALEAGHADDGIRLTLEGLKLPTPLHDMAAAHANLCAGYILLHQWDDALAHCNTSIALDAGNWRAFNNRAAVFVARGMYDQALSDIETGLKLAPSSLTLQKSLKIINANKKIRHRHGRTGSDA
jgi:tetratricopeptide (TPR) repeat protein